MSEPRGTVLAADGGMLTRILLTAALVVAFSSGCTPPPENPHNVSTASCDASLAEKLYVPGAIDSVKESHRIELSHGSEEYVVTGATLEVSSIQDAAAFEHALRCHSARARATSAATRAFDPLVPTGWAPEISVTATARGAGTIRVEVTSKHRETAMDILSRARALLERSRTSPPGDPSGAPTGT